MSIIHQNHWQILDLQRCCSSSLVILLSHCYHDPIIVTRILSWSWSGAVHLHSTPRRLPRRQNRQLPSSPLFSHRGRWWQRMLLMVWCGGSKYYFKSKFSKNIKVDKPTKGGLVSLLLLAIPTGRDISMYPEKVIFDFSSSHLVFGIKGFTTSLYPEKVIYPPTDFHVHPSLASN